MACFARRASEIFQRISSDGLAWRFQMPGWVAGMAEPYLDVASGIFSEWRQFYHWASCEGL